jgi:excinuclease UvrABC ATPase subunit
VQPARGGWDISLVIAEVVRIQPGDTTLQDALLRASQSALDGERAVLLLHGREVELLDLSEVLLDPDDEAVYLRPSDVLLSFNSQQPGGGRCPRCDGMGTVEDIDAQQLVARSDAPIALGGLALPFDFNTKRYRYFAPLAEEIRGLLVAHGLAANASWEQMPTLVRQELMPGSGNRVIQPLSEEGPPRGKPKVFAGLLERVRALWAAGRRRRPCLLI